MAETRLALLGCRCHDTIVQARHGDPFAVLGPCMTSRAAARCVAIPPRRNQRGGRFARQLTPCSRHSSGSAVRAVWCGMMPETVEPYYRLRITWGGTMSCSVTEDPYAFTPSLLSELDIYLLAEGQVIANSAACLLAQIT